MRSGLPLIMIAIRRDEGIPPYGLPYSHVVAVRQDGGIPPYGMSDIQT